MAGGGVAGVGGGGVEAAGGREAQGSRELPWRTNPKPPHLRAEAEERSCPFFFSLLFRVEEEEEGEEKKCRGFLFE